MTIGFAVKSLGAFNKSLLLCFLFVFYGWAVLAQTTTFSGSGNWSDTERWSDGVPEITWDVIIADGANCNIDMNAECNNFAIASGNTTTEVTISANNSLTVNGQVLFQAATQNNSSRVLNIADGSLICSSIHMNTTGANSRVSYLRINSGNATVNGDVTMSDNSSRNRIEFSGAGTLNVSGDLNNANTGRITANAATINVDGNMRVAVFTANSSTLNIAGEFLGAYSQGVGSSVNYIGGNQTIFNTTYYNLTISGGGLNPLRGAATIATGGTVTLSDGKLNLSGYDLTMETGAGFSGTFSNNAMLDFSNSGRLRYRSTTPEGWQRVFPIGTDNEYSPMEITGASGAANTRMFIEVVAERHPFLSGNDNAITRYWKLNPDNAGLQLTGTFTYHDNDVQAPIAEANLTTLGRLATTGWEKNEAGTGYNHGSNTISFDGVGNAINAIGIYTLGEDIGCFEAIPYRYTVNSGSWGIAEIWDGGTLPVAGEDIYLLHAVTLNTAAAPGNLTIEVTGSLNLNTQDITVTGTTDVYGSITDSNNAGSNAFQGLVTIHEGGQITTGNNSPFVFLGGIVNEGIFSVTGAGAFSFGNYIVNNGSFSKTGAGAVTFTANNIEISGSQEIVMNGIVTVTGVEVTNNGIVTFTNTGASAITGTGTWTQGNGSTLSIGGGLVTIANFNADASDNTVLYSLAANQTINTTTDYFNLIIQGQSTKTIGSDLTILNDFTIRNSTNNNLNINAGASSIIVAGNFIVSNDNFNATLTQTGTTSVAGNMLVNGLTFTTNSAIVAVNGDIEMNGTHAGTGRITLAGGSGMHTLSGTGTYFNLELNDVQGATLNNDITINGALTLTNGLITLGNHNLTLGLTTSSIVGTPSVNAMVVTNGTGFLLKRYATGASTFTFPIGETTGITEFSPVTLAFTANATSDVVGVRVKNAKHPNNTAANNFINRYWEFTAPGLTTYTYNASVFNYLAADVVATEESGIRLQYWNGAEWYSDMNSIPNTVAKTITSGSLTHLTAPLENSSFTGFESDIFYWSKQIGNWNGVTVWETTTTNVAPNPIGSGNPTTVVPTHANNRGINIRAGHAITTNLGSYTADQMTIESGGTLIMNANNFTLYNGTGTDLTNHGTITVTTGQIIAAEAGVTLAVNGTFNTSDPDGFSGGTGTSIANTHSPAVTLGAGSTVNYALNGAQTVTNQYNYKNLIISGGNTKTPAGNITIDENLTVSVGTFEITNHNLTVAGTTTLAGTLSDNNAAGDNTLNHVVFTGGTLTSAGNDTYDIVGDVTVTGGNGIIGQGNVTVTGTTTIDATRTLTLNNAAGTKTFNDITNNGTWTNSGNSAVTIIGNLTQTGIFNSGTGLYTFAGADKVIAGANALTITNPSFSGTYSNNNSNTVTFTNLAIAGTLTNNQTLTVPTSLTGAGTLIQGNGSTLNIGATAINLTLSALNATANANTVNYYGAAQDIKTTTYHNLTLSSSGIKTFSGACTINNNLTTIGSTTSFYSNSQIDVGGNLFIQNNAGQTMTFGGNASTLNVGGNIEIANAAIFTIGLATGQNKTLTVGGNIAIPAGATMQAANVVATQQLTLNGVINNSGTINMYRAAGRIANITINLPSDWTLGGTAVTLNNLILNNAVGARTITLDIATINLYGDLGIGTNNNVTLNGNALNNYGDINITGGGGLTIDNNAILTFSAANKSIQNAGTLAIEGSSGNEAILTASSVANRFFINNLSGSSLVMKYYNIDYLTGNGISVSAGSIADNVADNFSHGTFGSNSNSSQCLLLSGVDFNTHNPVTATNVAFNNTSGYNVSRTSGTGSVNFYDASGPRAGQSFENDNGNPGNLINWFYPSSSYFTIASGDFLDLDIWNTDPTGHFGNASSTFQIMDGHDVVLNGNIDVLELIVGAGTSGSLTIGNSADARTLTVREHLTAMPGAEIIVGSAATHQVVIYGNLINDGSIQFRASSSIIADVRFLGINSKINGTNTINFNSVTFAPGTIATAYQPINIQRNVIIEDNAIFDDGGLIHTVARDWTETGSGRRTGLGTIVFNGVVSTISSTDNSDVEFYNVICSGAGAVDFTRIGNVFTTYIYGDLTVNDTKEVRLINDHMVISGDFNIGGAARFSSTNSAVAFDGTSPQNINLAGEVTFYDLAFRGTSVKSVTGNVSTSRFLTIHDDATVEGTGSHNIGNTLTIDGTCNFSGNITMIAGSLTSNTNQIHFAQLSNLFIAGNIHITAISSLNVIVAGNVEIISNYLVINENTSLSNTGAGSFILGDGLNLYVRAADGFPSGFNSYQLAESSSVRYDRDMLQIVRGGADVVYGNLRFGNTQNANPQIRQADDNIIIKRDLDFNTTTRQIIFNLNGFDLTIGGNIANANSSTIEMSAGGTLTLNAEDANQTISAGTYNLTNLALELDAPSASRTKTIANGANITVLGNLTVTCGSAGAFINNIVFNDNSITGPANDLVLGQNTQLTTTAINAATNIFNAFAGDINLAIGTVHFANTTVTQFIPHTVTYGNVTFSGTQLKEPTGPLTIAGDIFVTANTPYFRASGFTHTLAGNWLLAAANTRLADMLPDDKIIFNGIDQYTLPSNFMHLEIANSGTASISGGNIVVFGDFTVKNEAIFEAGVRNISIHGNWLVETTGVFTQESNGFVNFVGQTTNQSIVSNENSYFWNITIDKNNGADNQTVFANSDINVRNNLDLIANAAVFNLNNHQLNVGRNLTIRDNTHITHNAFIPGTATVVLDGYHDVQHIHHYSSHALVFHNLVFNSPTNKYVRTTNTASPPSRDVILTGHWTNNFENVYGYFIGQGNSYVNFFVHGNWVNHGTFYHVNNGTVTFNGVDQQIGSSDFWNVIFANEGVKTLTHGHMNVRLDLLIEDNVTLDVSDNDYNILVARNWDMSAEGAVFNSRNGLVRFDGNGTIITGMSGENLNKNFYNIDVSASVTINGDLDVDNDFNILSGTFTTGVNKVYVGGDFYNNGTFTHTNNADAQVFFNATSGPRVIDPGSGVAFRTLTIDAPGVTYNVLNNFSINTFDLTVNQGTLNLNSNTITVNSNNTRIVIYPGGEFIVNENALVQFTAGNQSIQNLGGVLQVVGTPDYVATITRTGGSYYITQTAGVFHAQHYRFEMIGAGANGGITFSGGSIDSENNFSNGAFLNGSSTANSTAYLNLNELDIDNATNLVMSNVIFNSGGTTNRNILRNSPPTDPQNGFVLCQDCIGNLAGPTFEVDDGFADSGFVQWSYPSGFFWQGTISNDWHDNTNWEGGTAPDSPTHNVYFDPGTYIGPNNIATIANDISIGNVIILNNAVSLGFEVGDDRTLSINGLLSVDPGGVVKISNATGSIDIYNHWQNAGVFEHGNGTVRFMAPSSTINVLAGATSFYNVEFNSSGNAVFALGNNLSVANKLSIIRGTFDVMNRDITMGGDWYMEPSAEANFEPRNRTVFFTGSGQSITNGTFYNLNLLGSGTTTLQSGINISGDINIGTDATLDGQNFDLYVGRNWTNNNLFVQLGIGTVVFNGGNQQVDNGSQVTRFNRVIFAGTGTKTFHKASEVWGDLTINNGSNVDFSTFIIDGGVVENSLVNNGYMFINGPNNFPENFESIHMAPNSRVYYNFNGGDQIIKTNDATWSYGNLYLGNNSGTNYRKIPLGGDLTITGSLVISQNDVILDMNENSANMILTGNITLPAGGQQINWGTGTTKLTHVGGDWNISANIEGFNNLELGGPSASWKRMYNDLYITGDVTIKNGVRLIMDPNNAIFPKTMTCTEPGKTFTMENNSRLYCAITSDIGVAAPTGFENYNLANNANYYLRAPNGEDQTLYTANGIEYGNLTFQNTKNVASDGVAELRVNGMLNTGNCSFDDSGMDIFVRGNAHIQKYTSSTGVTFTFFGANQTITNGSAAEPNSLNFYHLVFSGNGVKTLGNRSVVNIEGNLQISSNVRLASGRDIYFSGENWNCEGRFEHAGGRTVYVSGTEEQFINPGPLHELNLFRNIEFTGENAVNFIHNGATINGNFTISGSAMVNMGELSHQITGNLDNVAGGTLQSALTEITFNGGNQSIRTPNFEANNLNIWGTGTKRMFSNWIINGIIDITSTLNNYNTEDFIYHDIEARSNWYNSGNFTHNNFGWVNFNASAEVGIDNGTSNFNNVSFGNDVGGYIVYNLAAPNTNIRRSMEINQDAHLLLNGNTLILGASLADGKNYLLRGLLDVDAGATLAFDNRTSACTLLVNNTDNPNRAALRIMGSLENVAKLTRSNAGGTEVVIDHGTIEAQYYLIEYLSNNGIDIRPNATLHPSNNFSNGTFSNINNVAGARYLKLEAGTYEGAEIENIAFNIAGVPVAGIINVERQLSDPPIAFGGIITGELGGYWFEKDEFTEIPAIPDDAARGRLRWPQVSETKWIGIVNADWNNPDNWSHGVPTLALDAVIPGGVPNDPVLNENAFCKSLRITSGTLEIDGGFDLTTYSDINIGEGTALGRLIVSSPESAIVCGGSWTRGTNGQFIHGNGTVIFNTASASATISPLNSNFHHVVFNNSGALFTLSGAVINILGNLELLNGTLVPNTSGYVINLGGDFNNQGNFTQGNGTVVLNGSGDQTITNGIFHHLTVGGSSTKYTSNECVINGNTLVTSTLQAHPASSIDFRGNVLIEAGAVFHDGDQTHTANGATWTGTGNYLGEGTVVFNRSNGNQIINASSFHNLEIGCTGRILSLGGDVTVSGNMTIKAGVSRVDIWDHLITNTTGLGEFYAENSVLIRITGADHFPENFISYFMENTTTVNYMGDSDQIIRGGLDVVYGNLTLTNSSVKTLDGDIEIQRELTFNTATLDVSPNNYTISIARNWNNNTAGGTFVARQGEVIFNRADGNQSILVNDNSVNPFYNLTVDLGANAILYAPNNKEQIIWNNLLVNDGRYHANNRTTTIGGDMYAVSGTFVNSGTFLLNKASGDARIRTNYNYNSNTGALGSITIDAGATYTLESDFAAYGDISLVSGTFNGNGHTVALGRTSAHTLQINGTYVFGPGGRLLVGNGGTITVGSSGVFEMLGTPGQNAILTNNMHHGGTYGFVMNGLIRAEHYQFMFMNQNGIRISSSGVIDATYNLSNGTFTNGQNNGTFLIIENNQTFTEPDYIANVNFPATPGGSLAKNVEKTTNVGRVEFYEATGNFSGELFEKDPYNRIDWTGQVVLTWNGSVNSDWNNAHNWSASIGPGIVPTGNEDVIITNVMNSPRLILSGQKAKKLTINPGARLIIETDYDDANTDLEVFGDFEILGNGTLEIAGINDFVNVAGSWFVSNTATLINNGHVRFNGIGAVKTINNGNKTFYNLTIEGSTSYVLANHTTVRNNFTMMEEASFDLSTSNFSMSVAGNWSNNGNFIPRNGTVTFNALSTTRSINNGSSYFHHVTINAPGSTYNLAVNDLRINGNMNLAAGTFNHNHLTVYLGDGIGSDELNVSFAGVYLVGPDGALRFGANAQANITNGGVFHAVGTSPSNRATVTRNTTGTYGFTVEGSGVFGAQYYLFEYMNASGIHLRPGAILDGVNNFSNGVFSNGTPGGTYIWLENEMPSHPDEEDILNIAFNNGPTYNITRLTGGTIVNISDAFGPMGNFTFENDAVMPPSPTTGLITWSLLNTSVWTGAVDNNWHNPANWLGDVPDDTKNVEITSGGFHPEIFEGPAFAQNISVESGAILTVNLQNLTITEELWFAGTITAIGSPHITVGGSWVSASGTFNAGQSRVVLNAAAGINTVNHSTGNFYALEISSAGTYNQESAIRLNNDLILTSGTLSSNGRHTYVGGSWINTGGSFVAGTRTVFMNGDGNNTLNPGSSAFYNLRFTGTAETTLEANTTVTRDYTQSSGNVNLNGYNLTINNRFTLSGGELSAGSGNITVRENLVISGSAVFNPNTSTVIMTATSGGTRSISPRSQHFYNLTINGNALFNMGGALAINNNLSILRGTLSVTTNNHPVTISGNILNNGAFSQQSGTVTLNGTNHQQIAGTSAIQRFFNLSVENSSDLGITLERSVTITGSLSLNSGRLNTSASNLLIIANGATASEGGDNSFINGPLRKLGNQEFLFPLGKDNIYAPLHITAPNLASNAFTAEYFFQTSAHVNHACNNCTGDINNVSTTEYWDLTRNSGISTPDVTLFFRDMERSGIIDVDDLILAHFNGTEWVNRGQGGVSLEANMCSIVGTGFTSYSPLTAASQSGTNPLPIELLYFEAACNESAINVWWATAAEINNDYFTIEASHDGINYLTVGYVDGAGNSNNKIEYRFSFTSDYSGLTYIRLKQTDFDGSFEYFKPVVVDCVEESGFEPEIIVYPNPTRGLITIHGIEQNSRIVIYDQLMKVVKTFQSQEPLVVLDLSGNQPGIYFIQIHSNDRQFVRRVIIQN